VAGIQQIKLPSRIESVDEAALKADEFAKAQGLGDDFVSAIDLAIRESVANAVKHGNKFAEEKTVDLTLARTDEGFEITVRDYGTGFDVDGIPDPTNPENLLKTHGRGILFMRSFMDVVEWSNHENGGMVVRMIKRQ
jgi:serine/threonine-protein kinase RsbW